MECVIRDLLTQSDTERRTLEDVLGRSLQSIHRPIISVVEATAESAATPNRPCQTLADWTSVYNGLSENQIAQVDQIVTSRVRLTRHPPGE